MTGEDEGHDAAGGPVELWAVPTAGRVVHWFGIVVLAGIVVNAVRTVLEYGSAVGAPAAGAGLVALAALVRMLRTIVSVYLDPQNDVLILFRTAGPALRTRPDHVRRLDRGLIEASFGSVSRYNRARAPGVRIVTDDGTATLSMLFAPDTENDLAQALHERNPDHCRVAL